jgi:hypothetical protein
MSGGPEILCVSLYTLYNADMNFPDFGDKLTGTREYFETLMIHGYNIVSRVNSW